jgi:hypothetical protein
LGLRVEGLKVKIRAQNLKLKPASTEIGFLCLRCELGFRDFGLVFRATNPKPSTNVCCGPGVAIGNSGL